MLLIICHCGEYRYAIDARHVSKVLPRVHLHALGGSPAWLAGVLRRREMAIPVIDLKQLTVAEDCTGNLSSRIIVLETELRGQVLQFGLLAERVAICEFSEGSPKSFGRAGGPAACGELRLDDRGVFQLIDLSQLISEERQAILFPAAGRHA